MQSDCIVRPALLTYSVAMMQMMYHLWLLRVSITTTYNIQGVSKKCTPNFDWMYLIE